MIQKKSAERSVLELSETILNDITLMAAKDLPLTLTFLVRCTAQLKAIALAQASKESMATGSKTSNII